MAKINAFGVITSSWTRTVGSLFPIIASDGESQSAPRELWNYLSPYHIHLRKWTIPNYYSPSFFRAWCLSKTCTYEKEVPHMKPIAITCISTHEIISPRSLPELTQTELSELIIECTHPRKGPALYKPDIKIKTHIYIYIYTCLHACLCMKQSPWVPTHHMIEANRRIYMQIGKGFLGRCMYQGLKSMLKEKSLRKG